MVLQSMTNLPNEIIWRIYYDDGSTRDSTEGLPLAKNEAHLRQGVLVILQYRSDGVLITTNGADYYVFDGEYWVPVGGDGLQDYAVNVLHHLPFGTWAVIEGRAIQNGLFNEIFQKAQEIKRKGTLD